MAAAAAGQKFYPVADSNGQYPHLLNLCSLLIQEDSKQHTACFLWRIGNISNLGAVCIVTMRKCKR